MEVSEAALNLELFCKMSDYEDEDDGGEFDFKHFWHFGGLLLIKTSEIQTSSSVIAFLNLPLIITFSKAVLKIRKAETNGKLDFSLN